jgi:DNA-binding HxlR family transcriptional regulator
MRKTSFAHMNCSVAQSLEIIGEWWTLLILRDSFLGIRRFDDFVKRLGISRNVLADRLDKLVDADILTRHPYDEARGRYDYLLTEKGRALWPVIVTLRQWGDEWIRGAGNEPLLLEHRHHGHTTTAQLTCDVCGERLDARSVRAINGPGAETDAPPSPRGGSRT